MTTLLPSLSHSHHSRNSSSNNSSSNTHLTIYSNRICRLDLRLSFRFLLNTVEARATMQGPTTFLLTSLLSLLSLTASAPADPAPTPATACAVPEIAFATIEKPFTLTALVDKPVSDWFVLLNPPTAQTAQQPYISHTKIAPPVFRLTNGKLTTGGPKNDKFPAGFGPTIAIFPPVLQPLLFGGGESPADFFAGYACDASGKRYRELRTNKRKLS